MALTIYWGTGYQGYDMHVLRNNLASEDLTKSIYVLESNLLPSGATLYHLLYETLTGNEPQVKAMITSCNFLPNIVSPSTTAASNSILNVTVGRLTGIVTATTYSGANYLKNFNFIILGSIVTTTAGTIPLNIRCHVHETITGAWLTPSTLTVRPDANNFKFTVLAQFSDDVIGDITRHNGFGFQVKKNGAATSDISITSRGQITVSPSVFPFTTGFTVSPTLPAFLNNVSPNTPVTIQDGNLDIVVSWKTQVAAPKPALIANPASLIQAGPGKIKEVKNFLFVSEGFTNADSAVFEELCNSIRTEFAKPDLSPWNHLAPDINFWRVFLESRERGTSCLNELVLFKELLTASSGPPYSVSTTSDKLVSIKSMMDKARFFLKGGESPFYDYFNDNTQDPAVPGSGYFKMRPTPISREQNPVSNFKTHQLYLDELISIVGLPTKYDKVASLQDLRTYKWNLFSVRVFYQGLWQAPSPSAQLTNEGQSLPIGDLPNVTLDLFECWRRCADRYLADEIDNVFGLASGNRPSCDLDESTARIIKNHPFRADRVQHMNELFINLAKNIDSTADNWTIQSNVPKNDFSTVAFLCAGARYGGGNIFLGPPNDRVSQLITTSLEKSENVHYEFTSPTGPGTVTKRKVITPWATPNKVNDTAIGVIVHEFSHSFSLFDEYGRNASLIPAQTITTINASLNLQLQTTSLLTPATTSTPRKLDADRIKWRLIRYEKAAVLLQNTVPVPNAQNPTSFQIVVKKEYADLFANNEKVHLVNQHFLFGFTFFQPPPPVFSEELTILSITPTPGTDNATISVSGNIVATDYLKDSKLVKTAPSEFTGHGQVSSNGINLSGAGTEFTFELAVGFEIIVGADRRYVTQITNNLVAQISSAFPSNLSLSAFSVQPYGSKYALLGLVTSSGTTLTGSNTSFLTSLRIGSLICIGGNKFSKVTVISSNTSLTMDVAFSPDITSPVAAEAYAPLLHAEIISDMIRRHMTLNAKTLTYDGSSPGNGGCVPPSQGGVVQTPDPTVLKDGAGADLIPKLTQPLFSYEIVGLYSGGAEYGCGVFHPTGACMMRDNTNVYARLFCPVCKYTLVELINPGRHNWIDAEYVTKYPKI